MVVRPFFYTFVPTKRERVCFQSVVRRVVKRQSKYCYKNATQPIVRIGIGLKYNDIGEVGSQTSLSANKGVNQQVMRFTPFSTPSNLLLIKMKCITRGKDVKLLT